MNVFRAYDIRGTYGEDLTTDLAEKIGRAFGSMMATEGHSCVIVGRDNRLSSPDLAIALMAGVCAAGVDVSDIGMVATPIVYHASVTSGNRPAVMVTGSHLPPQQNGFKMTVGTQPFYGPALQALRQKVEDGDFATGRGQHQEDPEAASRYVADLAGRLPPTERPFKVVVDAGNGMAGLFAPTLLRYLGHQVIELYCNPDGRYPNHPADPFEEENLHDARAALRAQGADLALVFDGDVDRLGMIDAQGEAHPTDRLLIPLVWDVLKRYPGAPIVTDALVSQVLIATIKGMGGEPILWKSGHSNIKNKMQEVGAPLALETSGHVFIADGYYGFDDGIYTGLRMLELLSRPNTAPLHDIMAAIPHLHTTPQYRPPCPEEQKAVVIAAVADHFRAYEVNTVDGVRVTLPGGWFILRASNTEAKLSLRFEANTPPALAAMFDEVAGVLKTHGISLDKK